MTSRRGFLKMTAALAAGSALPAFPKGLLADDPLVGKIIDAQTFEPIYLHAGDSLEFTWTFPSNVARYILRVKGTMHAAKRIAISGAKITREGNVLYLTSFNTDGDEVSKVPVQQQED